MARRKSYKLMTFLCILMLMTGFGLGYLSYRWTSVNEKEDSVGIEQKEPEVLKTSQTPQPVRTETEDKQTESETSLTIQEETNVVPVDIEEQKKRISINTNVVFKRRFLKCNHITVEQGNVPQEMINLTEDEVIQQYPDWEIEKFDNDEVVLVQDINDKCLQHYIVKEYEGKIGIFHQSTTVKNPLKQVLQVNVSQLREDDRKKLQQGIYVESDHDLAQLMEDFGS